MSVRLGYACLPLVPRDQGIFCSRTLTLKSLAEKGVEEAKKLMLENIEDLIKIIQYNEDCGIRFFRCTSNLCPHAENPRAPHYDIDFAADGLKRAGDLARRYGHRITMHPGQYVQLGSPHEEVVAQSVRDLNLHAKIFQMMGLTPEMGSVMIVHGGGTFGDKAATLARWEATYRALPPDTRKYISAENDEFSYSVMDLLPMCEKINVPLCVDFFHHLVGHSSQFNIYDSELMQRVMNTWKLRGIKPKCHWSNQAPNARKGTHADCVEDIPKPILDICVKYGCDAMLETKLKDLCVIEVLQKYFYKINNNGRIEWYLKDYK